MIFNYLISILIIYELSHELNILYECGRTAEKSMEMKTKPHSKLAKTEEGLVLTEPRTIELILGLIATKAQSLTKPTFRPVPASRVRSKAGKSQSRGTA